MFKFRKISKSTIIVCFISYSLCGINTQTSALPIFIFYLFPFLFFILSDGMQAHPTHDWVAMKDHIQVQLLLLQRNNRNYSNKMNLMIVDNVSIYHTLWFLSLAFCLSHSLPPTLLLPLSLTHTLFLSLPLSLSLRLSYSLTHSLSSTLFLLLSLSLSLSLSHTLS